jgi:hypothetical protein
MGVVGHGGILRERVALGMRRMDIGTSMTAKVAVNAIIGTVRLFHLVRRTALTKVHAGYLSRVFVRRSYTFRYLIQRNATSTQCCPSAKRASNNTDLVMRYFSPSDSQSTLTTLDRGIELLDACDIATLQGVRSAYYLPFDHRDSTVIAHRLVAMLNETCEKEIKSESFRIILISEWGVWPSSEDMHLYKILRQSQLSNYTIAETPGHVFSYLEAEDFFTHLCFFLRSGWGGWIAGTLDQTTIGFTHDEALTILVHDDRDLAPILKSWNCTYDRLK